MPSLIPGYEYDIFISYRQKDNKHDGWVTEFVNNLKDELESTFKEEVSLYFDFNPNDGLLETHEVNESLKEKLNCFIFIPIISRTYCDPRSFAWQNEFKEFVNQASNDQFGLKIKLPNGNIASRVLPVRIYDLDNADIKLCESVLGGGLRGVEFIYKEPGVNRPLLANEDNPHDNLNHTIYRNQINKVANSIKEIITGIGQHTKLNEDELKEVYIPVSQPKKNLRSYIFFSAVAVFSIIGSGYFFFPKIFNPLRQVEKSIAVLPFKNISPNDSTTYFVDGVVDEILKNLQSIKVLRVISRTSAEQYRNQLKSIPQIAKELGVNYIVEGSGQKSGNMFRLIVQLIKADKEGNLFAKSYELENPGAKEYFHVQSQIAQAIAEQLEAVITPQEKKLLEKTPTLNLEAYDAVLKGEYYRKKETQNDLGKAMKYYRIALQKDPQYARAYYGIAWIYSESLEMGFLSPSEGLRKEYEALIKAQNLDSTLSDIHLGLATYKYNVWDLKGCESEYQKAITINPNDAEAHAYYSLLLNKLNRPEEAMAQIGQALKLASNDPLIKSIYGMNLIYTRRYDEAINVGREALNMDSVSGLHILMLALHLTGKYDEALELWKKEYSKGYPGFSHAFSKGFARAGYTGALSLEADTIFAQSKTKHVNPVDIAILYVCAGNKNRALDCLELAFKVHDVNLTLLTFPIFDSLRNEPRYQALCGKMNLPIIQIR